MAERDFPFLGLSGGRALLRSTGWNLIGYVVPLVAGVAAVPILLDSLGIDRFGVLLLALAVLGYFGFFDLGIGRATTKYVAEYLATGRGEALRALAWTSICMLGVLGILAGALLAGVTPLLVDEAFNVPRALEHETQVAFFLLAAGLPAVLVTPGTRGVLEAQQRFGTVNLVKAPANVTLFALPVAVLPFSHSLIAIVAVLVASRYAVLVIYLYLAVSALPAAPSRRPTLEHVRLVLPFAGWTTLANALGHVMVGGYLDRFFITSLLSVKQAAYYATGFEVINRLWFLPASLLSVVFPTFSALSEDPRGLAAVHHRAIRYVWLLVVPVGVVVVATAEPLLRAWVGRSFADETTLVLQLLASGLAINSLAHVAFALVQAVGRPDLIAKRHMFELPVYVALMLAVIPGGGIEAAAAVWLTWACADAAILIVLLRRLVPGSIEAGDLVRLFGSASLLLALAFGAGAVEGTVWRVGLGVATVALALLVALRVVLEPQERSSLGGMVRRRRSAAARG